MCGYKYPLIMDWDRDLLGELGVGLLRLEIRGRNAREGILVRERLIDLSEGGLCRGKWSGFLCKR